MRLGARDHERLRLTTFSLIAFVKLIYFLGGTWDIQWHITVGRDSLFIPPHLVAGTGFVLGLGLALTLLVAEQHQARSGAASVPAVRVRGLVAPLALWVMLAGYASAAFAIFLDDQWHRAFGLDAKLWSPPHLYLMASTALIDIGLLAGLASSAQRLHLRWSWRNAWCWALVLVAAYLFDTVNFALSEAFVVAYQGRGVGLLALLYPILAGALLPLPLLLLFTLTGRWWLVVPVLALVLALQYIGTGAAELGFAILKPASQLEQFLRENPQSTIGICRVFAQTNGFTLVGLQQAWMLWLWLVPLVLVALLTRWGWTCRHPLVAVPVWATSLVLVCAVVFPRTPAMATFAMSWGVVLTASVLATAGGLLCGLCGLWLARRQW